MSRVTKLIGKRIQLILAWSKSLVVTSLMRKRFSTIDSFCLFIGYPRSGHSLIASLLNAHPQVMIAMEWGTLLYFRFGFRKKQIIYYLLKNCARYSSLLKNTWTGYSYKVADSWQGKFQELKVIGDKQGGKTSMYLEDSSSLLYELRDELNLPLKLLHVVRNPFDVISTMTLKNAEKRGITEGISSFDLLPFINSFFKRADTVMRVKHEADFDILDVYHEAFIREPEKYLETIINFLALEADSHFYKKCSTIVYSKPNPSRQKINWPDELIILVTRKMKDYPYFAHYSFSD